MAQLTKGLMPAAPSGHTKSSLVATTIALVAVTFGAGCREERSSGQGAAGQSVPAAVEPLRAPVPEGLAGIGAPGKVLKTPGGVEINSRIIDGAVYTWIDAGDIPREEFAKELKAFRQSGQEAILQAVLRECGKESLEQLTREERRVLMNLRAESVKHPDFIIDAVCERYPLPAGFLDGARSSQGEVLATKPLGEKLASGAPVYFMRDGETIFLTVFPDDFKGELTEFRQRSAKFLAKAVAEINGAELSTEQRKAIQAALESAEPCPHPESIPGAVTEKFVVRGL